LCPSQMINRCSPPQPRIGSRIPNFGSLFTRPFPLWLPQH
jgi:hypothetical protein